MSTEAVDQVITQAGSQTALARALGVKQPVISHWRRKGWMPLTRAVQCEQMYGVSRLELVKPSLREVLQ